MDQKLEKKYWSEPMNFLKRKNKVIIILLIIAVIAGGFAVYQYTRPKEVTNFDVEFEVDQEKPEEEETPGGVEEGIQIPGIGTIELLYFPARLRHFEKNLLIGDVRHAAIAASSIIHFRHLHLMIQYHLRKHQSTGSRRNSALFQRPGLYLASGAMTPNKTGNVDHLICNNVLKINSAVAIPSC